MTFSLLQNLQLTDSVPVVVAVQPGETLLLTRLLRLDPDASTGARPVVSIDLGSSLTQPDPNARYSLPFGGHERRQLVGGYGSVTHLAQNFYALDFAMTEGTPVLAAQSGVVVEVQDGYTEGGLTPDLIERANLVAVAHADGTLASYGHLSPGVVVDVGDSVARGERLGLSGTTGFSGTPHLHFHVGKLLVGGGPDKTIPVAYEDDRGRPVEVVEGRWYEPSTETRPTRPGEVFGAHEDRLTAVRIPEQ